MQAAELSSLSFHIKGEGLSKQRCELVSLTWWGEVHEPTAKKDPSGIILAVVLQ